MMRANCQAGAGSRFRQLLVGRRDDRSLYARPAEVLAIHRSRRSARSAARGLATAPVHRYV